MATVEELKLRIRELENELIKCKQHRSQEDLQTPVFRPKIEKMSAEVLDSNPYRCEDFHTSGLTTDNQNKLSFLYSHYRMVLKQ